MQVKKDVNDNVAKFEEEYFEDFKNKIAKKIGTPPIVNLNIVGDIALFYEIPTSY